MIECMKVCLVSVREAGSECMKLSMCHAIYMHEWIFYPLLFSTIVGLPFPVFCEKSLDFQFCEFEFSLPRILPRLWERQPKRISESCFQIGDHYWITSPGPALNFAHFCDIGQLNDSDYVAMRHSLIIFPIPPHSFSLPSFSTISDFVKPSDEIVDVVVDAVEHVVDEASPHPQRGRRPFQIRQLCRPLLDFGA